MTLKRRSAGISRNHLLISTGLLLLVVHTVLWMLQNPFPGHDQCALLFDARRMLSGDALYGPYLSETNPPLIIWFSAVPVFLSQVVHVRETTMLYLVLCSLICLSVGWSLRIAQRSGLSRTALLLLAFALVLLEAPRSILIFAQREDLLLICVVPYMLALALDCVSAGALRLPLAERCLLGIAAGAGVCFKPQQILLLVGAEFAVLLISRSFRHLFSIEFLCATCTCVLYVGAISVFAPLYFKETLPILVDVYWALGAHSAGSLALRQLPELSVVFIALALALFVFKDKSQRRPVLLFAACAFGASVAFDIQHTGWGYQRYPAVVFAFLTAMFLVLPLLSHVIDQRDGLAKTASSCLIAALVLMAVAGEWKGWHQQQLPNDAGTFAGLQKGDTVYVLSTDVTFFYLAYSREMNWGSRFVHLWMLPGILENVHDDRPADAPFKKLSPHTLAKLSALQRTDLATDLEHWQPKVVLVENCPCPFINQSVDLLQWFSAEPAFRTAWSHYEKVRDITGLQVYRRAD